MNSCAKCKCHYNTDPHYFEVFTTKLQRINDGDFKYFQHSILKGDVEKKELCYECKTKLDQWFDSE
jgi:hypothetical protein